MANNPQHQLTGSEELDRIISDAHNQSADLLISDDFADDKVRSKAKTNYQAHTKAQILAWHTKHLAKAHLMGRLEENEAIYNAVDLLDRKQVARPANVLRSLASRRRELEAQLASMEKTDDK